MATLYELTKSRLELKQKLESLDLDVDTINDTLEGESAEITTKIEDYGFVISTRQSFENEMKLAIDKMTERYKRHIAETERIQNWLVQNMDACGISRIECAEFSVSVKANPASVVILDEAQIPDEYMRLPEPKPPVPQPDKVKIKDAIKSGVEVAGCKLESKRKLLIL